MRSFVISLLLFFISVTGFSQGLGFYGHDRQIDQRTSFRINPGLFGSCHRTLVLSFGFKTLPGASDGYIFRMRSGRREDSPIINFFYEETSDSYLFKLILEGKRFIAQLEIPKSEVSVAKDWVPVSLTFDSHKDSATLRVGDSWEASGEVDLPVTIRPRIWFGKSEYLIDVPSFAISDLVISFDGDKVRFPLDEDSGDIALSSRWYLRGKAVNPIWLLNDSYHFKRISTVRSSRMLCAGFDPNGHRVYMFDRDSVFFLDLVSERLTASRTANPCPVVNACATSFIDPLDGSVYAYQVFYDDDKNKGLPTVARLDPSSLLWTPVSSESLEMQMHHHAQWLDSTGRRLTIFGGYGNRRYNGFFYDFDLTEHSWSRWDIRSGDEIFPRFFCSMGYDNASGNLLIYGGMGNESGDQIVGREYSYDLFEVNPVERSSRRLWAADWKGNNCVAVRGMVVDGDGFYTLCYPEYETLSELGLYRFSLKNGDFEILGDPIPINSDKITSNANLYYDRDLGVMIALVEESPDDRSSSVSTYLISYPPGVQRISTVVSRMRQRILLIVLVVVLILAVALVKVFFRISARRKDSRSAKLPSFIRSNDDKPDSIYLFGDLTVIDRDGKDITTRFTSKLRQMFLIVLDSLEDGGASSKKISGLLWPDKEEDKAKNLRGVTANNLRKFLAGLDGIKMVYEDGKFGFDLAQVFNCDYLEFQRLLNSENPDMDAILAIVARGKFLKNESDPMFDKMKAETERRVKSVVTVELSRRFSLRQYENTVLCADILFSLDPLDDDALIYSVRALAALGEEEKAGRLYQAFITKYKKDYGEDYSTTFESILSDRN